MARLQHVVIYVKDPVQAAPFYENLGLKKIIDGADKFGPVIGFSDGYVNWTLLPAIDGRKEGIDHVGFLVDDAETTATALLDAGGSIVEPVATLTPEELEAADLPVGSAQVTISDLAGVNVELGVHSWPH